MGAGSRRRARLRHAGRVTGGQGPVEAAGSEGTVLLPENGSRFVSRVGSQSVIGR